MTPMLRLSKFAIDSHSFHTDHPSIICVHGLNGDRLNTFSELAPDGTRYIWISEDLPQTLLAQGFKCRIFSYGNNAATHTGRLSLQDLWDHGEQLLSAVSDKRAVEGAWPHLSSPYAYH